MPVLRQEASAVRKEDVVVPVEEVCIEALVFIAEYLVECFPQLSPIAHPMAGKKLSKRLHRTIRKGILAVLVVETCQLIYITYRSVEAAADKTRCEGGGKEHS